MIIYRSLKRLQIWMFRSLLSATMRSIGTHNGVFHCDEALACAILRSLPDFKESVIVRTRDPKLLEPCDVVVDVGGVFDHDKKRYDHHQKTFTETMSSLGKGPWTTKLSSAGLVYAFYGKDAIKAIVGTNDVKLIDMVYAKVYENFVEEIDGVDNGVSCYDGVAKYKVTTTLSSRVGFLRPSWREESQDFDEAFTKAMDLVFKEFKDRIRFYSQDWWPARELVCQALESRYDVHASGRIIVLENGGCPFKEHLFDLEDEQDISGQILFAIFKDMNGSWRVLAISVRDKQFESRLNLHKDWRGLRDEELSEVANIPGCVFVHTTGFIGGNLTKEGALEMAIRTMAADNI